MAGERSHRHSPIVPELRRLHSPDLLDLEHGGPEDSEDFCMLVQAMIGPKGQPGEESFDFVVCTPKWLMNYLSSGTFLFGRHYLVLPYYDYTLILDAIRKMCATTSGSTWHEVGELLGRYGKWEFEDYFEDYKANFRD